MLRIIDTYKEYRLIHIVTKYTTTQIFSRSRRNFLTLVLRLPFGIAFNVNLVPKVIENLCDHYFTFSFAVVLLIGSAGTRKPALNFSKLFHSIFSHHVSGKIPFFLGIDGCWVSEIQFQNIIFRFTLKFCQNN